MGSLYVKSLLFHRLKYATFRYCQHSLLHQCMANTILCCTSACIKGLSKQKESKRISKNPKFNPQSFQSTSLQKPVELDVICLPIHLFTWPSKNNLKKATQNWSFEMHLKKTMPGPWPESEWNRGDLEISRKTSWPKTFCSGFVTRFNFDT